jgi:predicted small lipoprotein YifL
MDTAITARRQTRANRKVRIGTLAAVLALSASLSGCAVYGPPPAETMYYPPSQGPAYPAYPATTYTYPAYVYPAPAVTYAAPVYVPPVSFGLNFLYRGGDWHGHSGRGWGYRR